MKSKYVKQTISIQLMTCAYCEKAMVPRSVERADLFTSHVTSPFTLANQMTSFGWVFEGMNIPGGHGYERACIECVDAGKVQFTCTICKQERTSDQLHETRYGNPECKVCYETMPAKAWEEWHDEQDHEYRYG